MTVSKLAPAVIAPVVLACVTLVPAPGFAAQRSGRGVVIGRAVPRGVVRPRVIRPVVVRPTIIAPYRPYFYPYRSGFSVGIYAGYPYGYSYPYGYGYPYSYGYPYDYYGYAYPYMYPYATAAYASAYGSVRIEGAPRDAQVFADGYYVGIVDDFDGAFQRLNLTPGAHRIEIRAAGSPPIEFDVRVEPGRTITYHADLPRQ